MLEETRLHRILALLSTLNRVSTEQIIQHLGVSRETVRRDVLKLETMGVLRRVHGGIIAIAQEPELPLSVRSSVREKEKQAIARAAVQQLRAGQTVFIDAGSTTARVADELLSMSGMTVITNSLNVALKLTAAECTLSHEVILLGGYMGRLAQASSGDLTIAEIQRYRADTVLLSPVGIDVQSGASSFSHPEASIAMAMIKQSKSRIIMADHSKIGVTSRVIYATPSEIDTLITDNAALAHPDWSVLQETYPQVIVA